MPNYQKLKTMVKRSIDQKLRLRNFDARHEKIETGAVVKSPKGPSGVERGKGICYQWKSKKCSVRKETNVVSGMRVAIVQSRHQKPHLPLSHKSSKTRGRCREKEMPEAEAILRSSIDRRVKYFLKGTCTKSPCEYWHPPECQFYKTQSGCKFGAECSFPHWKVEEQPNKRPKKDEDKSAVAIVKSVRQLSCVSQDTEPPDSVTFF